MKTIPTRFGNAVLEARRWDQSLIGLAMIVKKISLSRSLIYFSDHAQQRRHAKWWHWQLRN
jgi:hypothetical protein